MEVSDYHSLLESLKKGSMEKEWFLAFSLGETGMTVQELLELRPEDLFSDGVTHALAIKHSGKRGAPRVLHPISSRTAGVFGRWASNNKIERNERIFPYGKHAIYGMWKKALEAASLTGYDTRSLRHMYGILVAMATDDEKMVARYLRMRDFASARFYVKEARRLLKGA
jgi:integrase